MGLRKGFESIARFAQVAFLFFKKNVFAKGSFFSFLILLGVLLLL